MHKLAFPLIHHASQLIVEQVEGVSHLFDPIRKYLIKLTPEEMVRQSLLIYLLEEFPAYRSKIAVEKEIKVNLRKKRFDMLIYDASHKPMMLIECKAPTVKITQSVMDQVAWYNVALRAPYLLITNGETTYCAVIDFEQQEYAFLEKFPL
ncbi:MAG TPA: type I restriction enzyme HsdR N-terminal domain-containing protein [Saprospiraceae bacterium]|nr:type I restriction enzyme HsdR N-terminal domain-containing protein [Saprospiraceae bacterium]